MARPRIHEDRIITTIYVRKDIREFCKDNGIKLSDWVEETFTDKFFSMNSKIEQLEETKKKEEVLLSEIRNIKKSKDRLHNSLSIKEIAYLRRVPDKLDKGFNFVSMKNYFNNHFGKKLSLDEFRSLIDA